MRLSGHLVKSASFFILKQECLGCKGSWVQIPPRRPFNSNTYIKSRQSTDCLIFHFSPQERIGALGTNSEHSEGIVLSDFGGLKWAPDSHYLTSNFKFNSVAGAAFHSHGGDYLGTTKH